jgi:hypothetical protein
LKVLSTLKVLSILFELGRALVVLLVAFGWWTWFR